MLVTPIKGVNPFIPMGDQEKRLIPYEADRRREEKYQDILSNRELFVDPIPNSPNAYHKNCMADSKENY